MNLRLLALPVAAISIAAAPLAAAEAAVSLRTVEGQVVEVRAEGELGEGKIELLTVRLRPDDSEPEEGVLILLAPFAICEEIGFEVVQGDRLRARVFLGDQGPARAQKALNMTRGRMARFRTLRDMPLWTASGAWHGGPSRSAPSAGPSRRHRGGGPG
jgi:hypothetical protein